MGLIFDSAHKGPGGFESVGKMGFRAHSPVAPGWFAEWRPWEFSVMQNPRHLEDLLISCTFTRFPGDLYAH